MFNFGDTSAWCSFFQCHVSFRGCKSTHPTWGGEAVAHGFHGGFQLLNLKICRFAMAKSVGMKKIWRSKEKRSTGFFLLVAVGKLIWMHPKARCLDLKDNSWKCGKQQVIFEVRKVYPETPQGLSSKCNCVHRGIAYAHRFQFHPNEQMRFHDTWHQRQVHDQNECQSGLHLACSTLRLQVRKVIF